MFTAASSPRSAKNHFPFSLPVCLMKFALAEFSRISNCPSPSQSTTHSFRRPLFPATPALSLSGSPAFITIGVFTFNPSGTPAATASSAHSTRFGAFKISASPCFARSKNAK